MREINVTLGDREFTIHEQPIRKSQTWRINANELLGQFTGINASESEAEYMINLQKFLGGSLEQVLELVFDYSPALAEEREWILDHAYERDIIVAFRAIFKFAYPVDFLAQNLYRAMSGLPDSPTSTNSVEPNGASGQTNSTTTPLQS